MTNLLTPVTGSRPSSSTSRVRPPPSTDRSFLTPRHGGSGVSYGNAAAGSPSSSSGRQKSSSQLKTPKKPKPLDISHEEGVEQLNEEEYSLCTSIRVLPTVYFQAKRVLIQHAKTNGFYKKSGAQKLLRIDVNKIGKLYDYFYSKGWLPQGPDAEF